MDTDVSAVLVVAGVLCVNLLDVIMVVGKRLLGSRVIGRLVTLDT